MDFGQPKHEYVGQPHDSETLNTTQTSPLELKSEFVTLRDLQADRKDFLTWASDDEMYAYMAFRFATRKQAGAELDRLLRGHDPAISYAVQLAEEQTARRAAAPGLAAAQRAKSLTDVCEVR